MQIWIHDNKMKKITALNNDVPDMLSYTNSSWHSYLDQATSTFDFTIPKFSNGELHEDLKLINDECFVSFYVNGSYQVFYIATLQEDDFNIQLTCNNTNLEYALEYANPFNSSNAQSIQWYLEHMDLLSFAAVEIGNNEISDRKRTLTFDSQETKMNRLQSLMSKFEAEFEFKVELNRDGTYKRIVINVYQEADDTHHGIGSDRKDVVLYYSNGLKGVQVTSDKTQMFNAGVFDGKDGVNLANVEFSEKNADGVEEFYSRKGDIFVYAPLSMQRYPATMKPDGQDNWIRKDFQTEYESVNDLKAYALRTLKKYAYPLVTYTASVQSGFVSQYTDLKLGDTIRIIDKNFVGGLALEARVSEMIISFDNPANNSFVFTNYRKLDNKPSSALQTRIEQAVESKLPYRIELATTGGVTFKNNEGETIVKPSLYKGNLPYTKDVSWHWALGGVATVGTQYRVQARDITGSEVLTVAAYVGNLEVATTEITLTNVDDGVGVESIDRYFTSSDQSDGVTIEGAQWSDKPPSPTENGKYLWAYDEITYTDGTVTTTKPAAVGANFDVDAFRAEIAEDLKDVPNREEFENKIAEEIANSKAEIGTQIETAKTQAESNAKEYADTINQETAKVAELANAAAGEIKADLVNVKNNLTSTSLVANNAQAAVDAAKRDLAEVNTKVDSAKAELTQAKQDLVNVASELDTAKQDLADSVTAVNTKVDSTKEELTQAKQQLTTVADDLNTAKQDFQNAVSAVDTKATNLKSDLAQAKQDLTSQAQQLQAQANAQSELTKRVSTVEKTADGTKMTVSELTKTVAQNGKDITSVTNRTKTVEDDLANTKTTLTQVQTTANSASQKTATLETGLDGLSAKFDNLKIGGRNLLSKTNQGKTNWRWAVSSGGTTAENYDADGVNAVKLTRTSDASVTWSYIAYDGLLRKLIEPNTKYTLSFDVKPSVDVTFSAALQRGDGDAILTDAVNMNKALANKWTKVSCVLTSKTTLSDDLSQVVYLSGMPTAKDNYLIIKNIKLEKGNVATDYGPSDVDLEQKVAEYKQNADQNYASLQTTVQNLDGTVQHNKTVAEQTAAGFKTRIESLETYKDGESERANAYFESAKTETAKQLTAERTAIANNYVAKSTYTSDVTGIRNELSATTSTANATKTNLANYQASNDKVVASLKSSLQTTDGNVSNLQTKVEAVPGQITSAVTAVEGKIPTSVGGRNLWIQSKVTGGFVEETLPDNHITGQKKCYRIPNYQEMSFNIEPDFSPRLYRTVTFSAWVKYENVVQGSNSWNKFNCFKHELYRKNSSTGVTSNTSHLTLEGFTGTSDWKYITYTYDYSANKSYDQLKTTLKFNLEDTKSGTAWVTGVKVELGSIPSDYSPAPEDTASDINAVSSQIKQTADGMTLLATKTEVNSAKTELQSGINTATNKANSAQSTANNNAQTISTHTTQISALNTGLQAKVSQTDFNTLSGRVTTAENNIIAKANELSSKITSVEGAIEDTQSDITKLSSEIKQTTDGISLLATKTELNTAKNELQSGINTATNKANSAQNTANAAQSTANNNAQTINTHTTQISALNTGLQAKVSQSEFNTLSGRVTTAENNITAKANELSSKITSVEGKIPTSVGGRNLWIQSKVTGGFVEETLPDNHITGQKKCYRIPNYQQLYFNIEPDFSSRLYRKVTFSAWVKYENVVQGENSWNKFNCFKHELYYKNSSTGATTNANYLTLEGFTGTSDWKHITYTYDYAADKSYDQLKTTLKFNLEDTKSGTAWVTGVKVELGSIPSDYSPAPEDTATQISNLSSEIKQTADGMTLLATKTELSTAKNELQSGISTATNKANAAQNTANNNAQTISTHTTQISALNTGLQAKVSQTDFNTLSGRVTTAENNITAKANELSSKITSVEGKIPTSIGGRNLLSKTNQGKTNWSWNISSGGAIIEDFDTYGVNAVKMTRKSDASVSWSYIQYSGLIRKLIEPNTKYTLSFDVKPSVDVTFSAALQRGDGGAMLTDAVNMNKALANKWTKVSCVLTSKTTLPDDLSQVVYLSGMPTENWNWLVIKNIKLEEGVVSSDWSPAPEDTAEQISNLSSEFKQTTDAIKASVQSLDNSTVKSSSLTINADGIVMKAGKSTTDVANAIGSYFSVNQNAINLFSDKINVKGNMIVNGAITSDKIASKSINTAHLNGKIITADVIATNAITANAIKAGAVTTDKMSANSINGDRITAGTLDAAKIKAGSITASQIASGTITSNQIKAGGISSANIAAGAITSDKIAANSIDASKIAANSISSDKIVSSGITANVIKGGVLQSLNGSTNFELDTGKLFYNNNNTGVFRIQDGASTMGLKFSNTPISVNGTSRILSRAILGGDRRETTLDDGKWDKGGFSGVVIETIKGVEPTDNEQADAMRVIADNIYFTHTYSNDSLSARGWKMETYSPNTSYPSNVVLKPYGINYRNSNIVVGDLRLDNGDGSGYWMRATINTLKACFGHILNGGTSSQALNAIRSELNKISGI